MSDPLLPDDLPSSNTQIHQNAMGDYSQVIGQMLGGIVINQLTIHDRVPTAVAPPPISVTASLTQQEYRQRKVLLAKVQEYWVKGVLETSLHARALVELGLRNCPDLVQRPFREAEEFPEVSGQALEEGTSATTVFEQMGAGRTLLILGEPGSGKTITLLKLAEDLIARTERDLSQPIPVVFNLSSWARKPQPLEKWLIQELLEKYQVSKALGKQWVKTESLVLLLDGLDEVKANQRNACVQALKKFMQTYGTTEGIICCRAQDYQALEEPLMLRSALYIQPLTSVQVDQYFEQAGEQLESLKELFHLDEDLQRLTASPLMLSIMSLAYQNCSLNNIVQGGLTVNYRQLLFDSYIDRAFRRRSTTQKYHRKQTQKWLTWLAQSMLSSSQSMILVEQLQPTWLITTTLIGMYKLVFFLLFSVLSGLIIPFSLLFSRFVTSCLEWEGELCNPAWVSPEISQMLAILPYLFLSCAAISMVISGVTVEKFWKKNTAIKTVESLVWSWDNARPGFVYGVLLGLTISLACFWYFGRPSGIFSLALDMADNPNFILRKFAREVLRSNYLDIVIGSFLSGLIGGMANALIAGFTGAKEIGNKDNPNQGIFLSLENWGKTTALYGMVGGVIAILISGLIIGAFQSGNSLAYLFGVFLFGFLCFGFIAGLILGGITCCKHLALRLVLYIKGYSPWNYAHFLNYATERLILQKVGGGYIFAHRMLLEHFAVMLLE